MTAEGNRSLPIGASTPRADGYTVSFAHDDFGRLLSAVDLSAASRLAVISDETVAQHWLEPFLARLPRETGAIVLPPGEQAKTVETVRRVWSEFQRLDLDRRSLVFCLGGGVVGDLGGFAAATFMRGIDFVQVPTTLLAQVDASVGGKVGVNEGGAKNLVGAFARPRAVLVDTATLATLPAREFRSGLAECVKHALVRDPSLGSDLSEALRDDPDRLQAVVRRSIAVKADVVAEDEREAGVRKILNFGHTVGHALEAASWRSDSPLTHGEAVALGLLAETRLSVEIAGLDRSEPERLSHRLRELGLPTRIDPRLSTSELIERMRYDKKKRRGEIGYVLLEAPGRPRIDEVVPPARVAAVIESLRGGA